MRWQARVCGVAANKYSHMAHANMLSSYVFNSGLHAIHLLCAGEVNSGRDEGKMLTAHSSDILGSTTQAGA